MVGNMEDIGEVSGTVVQAVTIRSCLNCNEDISDKREDAQFCSDNCRKKWNRKNNPKEVKEPRQPQILRLQTLNGVLICDELTGKWFQENGIA